MARQHPMIPSRGKVWKPTSVSGPVLTALDDRFFLVNAELGQGTMLIGLMAAEPIGSNQDSLFWKW